MPAYDIPERPHGSPADSWAFVSWLDLLWRRLATDVRFKSGSFTRDTSTATGTQEVTGIGFRPRAVILLAVVSGTTSASIGADDGTSPLSIHDNNPTSAGTYAVAGGVSIALIFPSNPAITYTGAVASFDADGFTISWTRTGAYSGTATIIYFVLR